MAHRTSAAALHAARVVLEQFELTPIPPEKLVSGRVTGLTNSEAHVAIVIDKLSNVFELAELRPELRFWQQRIHAGTATAPQLMTFFKKALEKFSLVPRSELPTTVELETPSSFRAEALPEGFDTRPHQQMVTKAAFESARGLLHYYFVKPKRTLAPDLIPLKLAELIEVALGVSRAEPGRKLIEDCKRELMEGRASAQDVKKCLRALGIYLEYLPNYEEREEETKLLV